MGAGVSHGLQNRCEGLRASQVSSILTYPRQKKDKQKLNTNVNHKKERLRSLYKVDEVLQDECLVFFKNRLPHALIADSVREEIDLLRTAVLHEEGCPAALTDRQLFLEQVIRRIRAKSMPSLRPVINATGTVLHTNLGRSLLGKDAMEHVAKTACSYSTLEYDLKAGKRGSRHDHVERLICKVTGAEAAMVVNNNAAATMLVLSAMAAGGEVIVSRGELVEIGGSFRIPDIMSLSGAVLREVGTTNKTHLYDYINAIRQNGSPVPARFVGYSVTREPSSWTTPDGQSFCVRPDHEDGCIQDRFPLPPDACAGEQPVSGYSDYSYENNRFHGTYQSPRTAALMKVHTSNYRIHGFTEDVGLTELRKLGDQYHLPVIYDMGNGLLTDLKDYKIFEPTVPDAIKAGADIVLFSGDKLLGGPQAGIIIGKKAYIDRMKRHPLARVVRIDKMTLAALETLFFEYQDMEKAKERIPALQMLTCSKESLYAKAVRLHTCLTQSGLSDRFHVNIRPCQDFVGGGSAPDTLLEGYAVTLDSDAISTEQLERRLRENEVPIIVHVCQDQIWLHMRTVQEVEIEILSDGIILQDSW